MIYQRTYAAYGKIIGFVVASADIDDQGFCKALGEFLPDCMMPIRILVNIELLKNAIVKVNRLHYCGFFYIERVKMLSERCLCSRTGIHAMPKF